MSDTSSIPKLRVLVTGADGFVGRHLVDMLGYRGHRCRMASRVNRECEGTDRVVVGEIGPQTEWRAALEGIDAVVHLAARAHILREKASDPRAEFMRVNAEGTETLVSAAASAGVRRVIYVSSIGVHGRATEGSPFTEASALRPHNLYSESKLAGEVAARAAATRGLELVVLRPPLVYGSDVKANFLRLMCWVESGWPIPVGAVRNQRSFVNVWNLCDLIIRLLEHQAAVGRVWVVSDGEDLSTPQLVRLIGDIMRKSVAVPSVPLAVLRTCSALLGRRAELSAFCDSLRIDMTTTCRGLGWRPNVTVREGLGRTVEAYRRTRMRSPTYVR